MKNKTSEHQAVTDELKMMTEMNSKLTADMKIIKNRYKEAGLKINMLYDKITECPILFTIVLVSFKKLERFF